MKKPFYLTPPSPGPEVGFAEFMDSIQEWTDLSFQLSREETLEGRLAIARELQENPLVPLPFYHLWISVHQGYWCLSEAWTDDGYDPAASRQKADLQIMVASVSGHATVLNGGFHQFFCNHKGVFAPEMVEWLQLVNSPRYAALLKETMTLFGTEYPRSQEKRQAVLDEAGSHGYDWLDEKFRDLENSGEIEMFEGKAEEWLRGHLGVHDLQTPPAVNPQYARDS